MNDFRINEGPASSARDPLDSLAEERAMRALRQLAVFDILDERKAEEKQASAKQPRTAKNDARRGKTE